jgi:YtkA-like
MPFCTYLCSLIAALALVACGSAAPPDDNLAAASLEFPADPYAVMSSVEGALQIEVRTVPEQPPARGEASAEYRIRDASGRAVDDLELAVVAWMPAMGHGTSVKARITPLGEGRYVVSNLNLFMPGKWELRSNFSGPVTDRAVPSFQIP